MQLPVALRPWSTLLSLFPRDIALTLGTLVHRLYAVVGPLRDQPMRGLLEPDGIQGIGQRGLYERLVTSEWLLADELPDEFDRRAAMREHLFYDRDLREPSGTKKSVALFNCGPDQIGAPRIVQLAALILLARRAEAAGAQYLWGVLQDESCTLRAGVDPAGIKKFLRGRTSRILTQERVAAWRELPEGEAQCDRWVIGAAAEIAPWAGINSIEIDDVLAVERDFLHVTVCQPRGRRTLEVDLPRRNSMRARLLRDPLEQPIRSVALTNPRPLSMKRHIRFSRDGRRILAVLLDGGLGAFHIPNSPGAQAGKTRYCSLPEKHRLVAAEHVRRRFTVVSMFEEQVCVLGMRSRSGTARIMGQPLALDQLVQPVDRLGSFPRCISSRSGTRVHFLDGAGRLFMADVSANRMHWLDNSVRDFLVLPNQNSLIYARQYDGEARATLVESDEAGRVAAMRAEFDLDKGLRTNVFFGSRSSWQAKSMGVVAVQLGQSLWKLACDDGQDEVPIPEEHRVCGVVCSAARMPQGSKSNAGTCALVVLHPGRRVLFLMHRRGSATFVTSSAAIVQVAVDPDTQNVAYVTENRTLHVFSLVHHKTLVTVEQREER
ncbi:MAG: hypothetical protein JSW67_13185 [Candidatus Latescibacterota bacterium]|nr:MAG: hypothetical protein JSW67_13185 [Candidatus Latescibacterota bacterium]